MPSNYRDLEKRNGVFGSIRHRENKVAELELDDRVFGVPVNEAILYEVVNMQMAQRRQGTASTKGRSDVSGGGKKRGARRVRDEPGREPRDRPSGGAVVLYSDQSRVITLTRF
jgi:ribosomal protein L4